MSEGHTTDIVQGRRPHMRRAFAVLPNSALLSSHIVRNTALLATISLVAFAFYMTRPTARTASQKVRYETAHESQAIPQPEPYQNAQAEAASGTNASNHSKVTVNGKDIPVPANGNLDQTIHEGDSTTTVHLSSQGSDTSSSTHITVQSSTNSSTAEGDM